MKSYFSKLATLDTTRLSKNEKKVIRFIENNLEEIVATNMKIEKMAEGIGIGFSAIYSIIKRLKFQGYRDFIITLSNDYETKHMKISQKDHQVTLGYLELIKQNFDLIEKRAILDTINYFRNANKIFVCYWENSLMGPATEITNFFYRQRFNVHLLDNDQETISERINSSQSDDLFVIYTRYGTSTRLQKMMLRMKEQNAKIIYISGMMPNQKISGKFNVTHSLLVHPVANDTFKSNFSKSVPFHYFNDLLIFHYSEKFGDISIGQG